jgi:hypothetical protein
MKTAVYSWRVSVETKGALEEEARERGESLAELLDQIAKDWLQTQRAANADDLRLEERLRARATRAFGVISGGNPDRASGARDDLRRRLKAKRAASH